MLSLTTSKHTPGIWEIDPHSGGKGYEQDIKIQGRGWFLRISPGYPFNELVEPVEAEAEFRANARLIAAAPELLAACILAANSDSNIVKASDAELEAAYLDVSAPLEVTNGARAVLALRAAINKATA